MFLSVKSSSSLQILVFGFGLLALSCGSENYKSKLKTNTSSAKIANRYIIVLNSKNDLKKLEMQEMNVEMRQKYSEVFSGFSADLSKDQLDSMMRKNEVKEVHEVVGMKLLATQTGATWGIDRIDQEEGALNIRYDYNKTGKGVFAYVIDTGINVSHPEFEGRAIVGADFSDDKGTRYDKVDGHGHGSHVSGTIGSRTFGVAKEVNLIGVKVFNHNGDEASDETVIAGIDYAVKDRLERNVPAVANMSLGGEASEILDVAVSKAIATGLVFVVSAGNSNVDACTFSPARVPEAITIAASDKNDKKADFSNFGACVDLIAPGVDIKSTWKGSSTATNVISGTSMASPHVAGVAALALEANPEFTPAEVQTFLIGNSSQKKIKGFDEKTPNLLLSTLWSL